MNIALRIFYILIFLYYSCYLITPFEIGIVYFAPHLNNFVRLMCNLFFVEYLIELFIDLKKGRPVRVVKNIWWLIVFLMCAVVSCFYNQEQYLHDNLKWVKCYAIFFSLFLTINNKISLQENIKTFLIVADVVVAIGAIGCTWSLWQFINLYSGELIFNDEIIHQGIFEQRLQGCYSNANIHAVFAYVSLVLAFVLFNFRKNVTAKVYYVYNIVAQYFCVLLTGTRTSLYSFAIITGLIAAFYCSRKIIKNKLCKISLVGFVTVATVFVVLGLSIVVKKGLNYLPDCYKQITCYFSGVDEPLKSELQENESQEQELQIVRSALTLSGRDIVWKEYLGLWKESPWLGVGPRNHLKLAKERFSEALIVKRNYHPHNEFLYLLVSVGIIGIIPFVIWFCLTSGYLLKFIYKTRNDNSSCYFLMRMMSCIVVYFLLTGLTETFIVRGTTSFAFLFFYALGYLMYLCRE